MAYQGTFGVHFPIHQPGWASHGARELLRLAQAAVEGGFQAVWVNDNFKARHTYAMLAAMAARYPLALGTLITHPYARNPIDMATAFGTIAELLGERELTIGVSTGAWPIQGQLVERAKPTQSVAEAIGIMRGLLDGEEVRFGAYPALAEYFHLKAEAKLSLQFQPPRPVSFWVPPKGPRMARLAAERCDGVIFDTYTAFAALPFVRDGTLARTIAEMEQWRAAAGLTAPLRRVFKLSVCLAEDGAAARRFARNYVSFTAAIHEDLFRALGLPPEQIAALSARYRDGATIEDAAALVGMDLVDWVVLAGTPAEIVDRLAEYLDCADRLGFEQVILAVPTGPDPFKAVELASRDLLPRLTGRVGRLA